MEKTPCKLQMLSDYSFNFGNGEYQWSVEFLHFRAQGKVLDLETETCKKSHVTETEVMALQERNHKACWLVPEARKEI